MAYEKDLEYLREELKNSEDKLRQAGMNGYVTDAEMWESDVENLRHQIYIHERASKADEYKAKAKAFDEIFKLYIGYEDGWIHFPKGNRSFIEDIINVCKKYESGDHNV